MKDFKPEEVIVEAGSEESPIFSNLKRAFPDIPFTFVDEPPSPGSAPSTSGDPFGERKGRLFLMRHKGEFLKKCPGSDGQVCCNYFVVNFASNCPMECSYCYLQEYMAHNPTLKVFSNVSDLIEEAGALLSRAAQCPAGADDQERPRGGAVEVGSQRPRGGLLVHESRKGNRER